MIKAPYNFVPLAETVVFPDWAEQISIDIPFEDGVSGTINVQYTAQTPVFIGNGKADKNDSRINNYKAANGKYALPGSSLRGMLRNVIEIASFGKFSRIDDSILSFRDLQNPHLYGKYLTIDHGDRSYEALAKAGWLINESGGWFLCPVEYHRVEDEILEDIYHPQKSYEERCDPQKRRLSLRKQPVVYFELDRETTHIHHGGMKLLYSKAVKVQEQAFPGAAKGYTVLTGQPGRRENWKTHKKEGKHMDFIFEEKTSEKILLNDRILRAFQEANAPNASNQKAGYNLVQELRNFKECNYPGIPVFYLPDSEGKPDSMGLSQMYRLPYKNSLMAAVLHSSELHGEENRMDLPECLFGKIESRKDKNGFSLRGRIQFEDAVGNAIELDIPVSTILGNPKPSFYPNYIEQNPGQNTYTTLMDDSVRLRGWKRYPVRNQVKPIIPDEKQERQKTQFAPMKKGSCFEGKIHFHNLKPQELGALLWAITWNNQKKLSHAIGIGKPYGFGQIKAEIKSLSFLKNSTISNDYTEASADIISSWQNDYKKYMESQVVDWEKTPQLRELLAMADPENAKRPGWSLEHLKLGKPNEFVDSKKAKEYLAPYSQELQSLSLAGGSDYRPRNHDDYNARGFSQKPVFQPHSEGGVATGSSQICILLEEKTKKGGWKAKVKNNEEISGPVCNTSMVPADKNPGDEIKLKVRFVKGKESSFEYMG